MRVFNNFIALSSVLLFTGLVQGQQADQTDKQSELEKPQVIFEDFQAAVKKANETNQPIFVYVHDSI